MAVSPRILVLADDLTGAAEVAAVGHRLGLRSEVATSEPVRINSAGSLPASIPDSSPDLLVVNTDSRLLSAAAAAEAVRRAAERFGAVHAELVYKKVDSVLRGPVLAEVAALAEHLHRPTILLLPHNPSLGRAIRKGHYYVDGELLHQTDFARDPHHPAHTSEVLVLLAKRSGHTLAVDAAGSQLIGAGAPIRAHLLGAEHRDEPLPAGVLVAQAEGPEALVGWAGRIDRRVVAAGGAEFFGATLRALGFARTGGSHPASLELPPKPALLLSGTTVESSREFIARARESGVPVRALPLGDTPDASWCDWTARTLVDVPLVIVAVEGPVAGGRKAAARIGENFGWVAAELWRRRGFRHLLLEGGATAASALSALRWDRLTVIREWAAGVASLQSPSHHAVVTLKPGSYRWPEALWQHLPAAAPTR